MNKEIVPRKDLVPIKSSNGSNGSAPRNFIADFKAVTEQCDEQVKTFDELVDEWRKRDYDLYYHKGEGNDAELARDRLAWTREGAEECAAELQRLFPTITKDGKKLEDDLDHPSQAWITWRISEMVKVWPDAKLSTPKDYAVQLAKRLDAEGLNKPTLESVFREIEDTKSKAPVFADISPLLNKYKTKWQRRLDAMDVERIEGFAKELIFAAEFKLSVFVDACLEYFDTHGYTDLADELREGGSAWHNAVLATAQTEGLTELVDQMLDAIATSEPFKEAWRQLQLEEHVMAEWELLMLNAQQRISQFNPFVWLGCGAGYQTSKFYCLVCGGENKVVTHAKWQEQITQKQQKKRDELQRRQEEQRRQLKRREQSERPRNEWWHEVRAEREAWKREEQIWLKAEEDLRLVEEEWAKIAESNMNDPWSELTREQIAEIERGGGFVTDEDRAKQKQDEYNRQLEAELIDLHEIVRDQDAEIRELRDRLEHLEGRLSGG